MSIFAYLAIALAIFLAGAAGGWKAHVGITASRDLAALQAQERETLRRIDKIDASAVKHEIAKTRIDREIVEVEKEVVRVVKEPFYVDAPACLNDDGMRLVNQAAGHPAAPASLPASSVQRP